MTVDISERKKAELTVAERNLQLALAGKAALVGSFAYDTGTEIMQISEGYAAIHGFSEGTAEIERTQLSCCIWRYHPTRHIFEVVTEGTTNPWGLDWDDTLGRTRNNHRQTRYDSCPPQVRGP